MLRRYICATNFKLGDDPYFHGSTFMHEDNDLVEMLLTAKLITRPNNGQLYIKDKAHPGYIGRMNKTQLKKAADEEGVEIDTEWTVKRIRDVIMAARASNNVRGREGINYDYGR